MKTIKIKGTKRESVGKTNAKLLRKTDMIPCVLYGGKDNVHFSSHALELGKILYTPEVYIVKLDVDGNEVNAILKEVQFHPVTDKILHIDFLQVFDDKKVEIKVPVVLYGFSVGVKQGGKLYLQLRKLTAKALLKDIPDSLKIDVTKLSLGKTIKIGDLKFPNIEITDPKNWVVATVKLTRVARGLAAEEEAEEEAAAAAESTGEETKEAAE